MKPWLALAQRAVEALERIAKVMNEHQLTHMKLDLNSQYGSKAQHPEHLIVIGGGPCWCGKVHSIHSETYISDGNYVLQLQCTKDGFIMPSLEALYGHFQRCQGPYTAYTLDRAAVNATSK